MKTPFENQQIIYMVPDKIEFDSPQLHDVNGCKQSRYRFLKVEHGQNLDRSFIDYKPAKLKGQWPSKFIEYYYRHPETDAWQRFKVYEEINRNKSLLYDEKLLKAVNDALKKGFNPFADDNPYKPKIAVKEVTFTILKALNFFLIKWKERGLDDVSIKKYKQSVQVLIDWLTIKGLQFLPAEQLTTQHVEDCLRDGKIKNEWSNRTYNNYKSFLSTCFIFLVKKKIIPSNPCSDISTQKAISKKHKYYDDKTLKKVMAILSTTDPALHLACLVVYHLCVRSEKELQNLKVGNIFPDRMQVLLEVTKGKADRYIPMNEQILHEFKSRGVLKQPKDYYLFSGTGQPGLKHFGPGFFSKRFRKVRQAAGLSADTTIYSMKHTRIIHLKKDGASDAEIMALTGHKDFQSYALYLRDIGADVNPENIHRLSRSI